MENAHNEMSPSSVSTHICYSYKLKIKSFIVISIQFSSSTAELNNSTMGYSVNAVFFHQPHQLSFSESILFYMSKLRLFMTFLARLDATFALYHSGFILFSVQKCNRHVLTSKLANVILYSTTFTLKIYIIYVVEYKTMIYYII